MASNDVFEGDFEKEGGDSFFDAQDIFVDDESENPGKFKQFINNIPPQYRSLSLTAGLVVVLFVVCVLGFQMIYGGGPEELASSASGSTTNNRDIPQTDITESAILGENSVVEKERAAVEQQALSQAEANNSTAVATLDLSDLSNANIEAIEEESDNLTDAEKSHFATQAMVNDVTNEGLEESGIYNNDGSPAFDTSIPQDNRIRSYDFQQMLAVTATDTSGWDESLSAAINVKPFTHVSSTAVFPEESPNESRAYNDINELKTGTEEPNGSYHAKLTETHYAELIKPINTDDGGLVIARIISGPLSGSRIVGKAEILENKRLGITFDRARYKGVTHDGLSAMALSFDNLRDSLPAEVDNHYFSRYVPFILANMGGFWADSLISTLDTERSDGSSTTTTGGLEETSDQMKYSVGQTLNEFLPHITDMVNRKPTLTKERGEVFLVMFLNDYTFSVEERY